MVNVPEDVQVKRILSRRTSLSSDFFMFSLVIFIAVLVISLGFWMKVYDDELQRKHAQLPTEATRAAAVLADSVDYISSYAKFMGEKIVQGNPQDLRFVAGLIGGKFRTQPEEYNLFITTTFDWVTPDKQLRASSMNGVLRTPFDMKDREYLDRTPLMPWTLQTAEPRVGGLSKQWVLPAGMGFTDENGKFIGSITMGIALDALNRRLVAAVGSSDIRYIILTDDMNLVLDTGADNSQPNVQNFREIAPMLAGNANFLQTPLVYDGVSFSYYKKVAKYPFIILTGYSTSMANMLFSEVVLSRLIGLLVLGVAALVLLYLMRQRLVKPVMRLARAAERISCGESAVDIPKSYIQEIEVLGTQLQKISNYIQSEHQITQALQAARDEAVKASEAKSEFLANMSHEIRTPMNAVVGLANILSKSQPLTKKQREYVETLQISAHSLLSLLNDLLDISKIEKNSVDLEMMPFTFSEIINSTVNVFSVIAQDKDIVLQYNDSPDAKQQFLGDPLRLRQIMNNLIGNAVKFTEKGAITIDVSSGPSSEPGQRYVHVRVKDTGIGISQEKHAYVFDKFMQADMSITRNYGGSGLGLAICKNLAELMGGGITMTSEPGKGSEFVLHLPLELAGEQSQETEELQENPKEVAMSTTQHKQKVLLVEDYEANILVATSLLEDLGYEYDVARNGQEALNTLSRQHGQYSAVLMDVQMPVMDGFTTTRMLRDEEVKQGLTRMPIIGVTAHALAGDRQRCISAGMDDYIAKPFNPEELRYKLSELTVAQPQAAA